MGHSDGGSATTLGHLSVGLRRLVRGDPLALLVVLGLGWILLAPELATGLPYGHRPEPNATQLALTATGLVLITGILLGAPALLHGRRRWAWALVWAYSSAIVVIKFILSPAAFRNTPTTTLGEFVQVGLVAMVFYVVGLIVVYRSALRHRSSGGRLWTWPSKLLVVIVLMVLAVAARWVAAIVLGAGADEYFRHVYRGAGLLLPLLVGVTALLAVEAFDRAADIGRALQDGFVLILLLHALWVVYMVKMFR